MSALSHCWEQDVAQVIPTCKGLDHPINPAQWLHLQFGLFSTLTSGQQLVHQRLWYMISCCGKVHIKDPLLIIGMSSLCGNSGFCLKLRFHLSIMRMWMPNANATTNWKHRISIGALPFVWMRMRSMTMTKWTPSWAISVNAYVLLDQKSLHMHDRCRVAYALNRGKLHWSLNIIHIRNRRHICIMDKWNLSLKKYVTMTSNSQWHENQCTLEASLNKTNFPFFGSHCSPSPAALSCQQAEPGNIYIYIYIYISQHSLMCLCHVGQHQTSAWWDISQIRWPQLNSDRLNRIRALNAFHTKHNTIYIYIYI